MMAREKGEAEETNIKNERRESEREKKKLGHFNVAENTNQLVMLTS